MGERVLIGDIGGTNLRLALLDGGEVAAEATLLTRAFPGLAEAIGSFLAPLAPDSRPGAAFLAVAGPVAGDEIGLTNHPWAFSRSALAGRFGWSRLEIVNDFQAVALGLPLLGEADLIAICAGTEERRAPKLALGPGTGLGVGMIVPAGAEWIAVAGEGGHASLAAADDVEAELLSTMRRRYGHVSAERVLSGPGLAALHAAVAEREGAGSDLTEAADVVGAAVAGCPVAAETVARFSALLGGFAGDLALVAGARGGVYLAGGVLARMGEAFRADLFRERFEAKGRLSGYLSRIPVWRIARPEPGMLGLMRLAAAGDSRPCSQ